MEKAIRVNNLTKRYGSYTAINDISIEVPKGETFGLLGHNGAGKSTTIECILGVKTLNEGEVEVLGMALMINCLKLMLPF